MSKKNKMKQQLYAYALVMPAFLVVMLVVAYPIVSSLKRSFTNKDTGAFTLEHYRYFFENEAARNDIIFTLKVVITTVLLASILAYLLALYLRFSKSKISKLIGVLYLIPRFVPSLVAVYSIIIVIKDTGVLNRISQLFGYNFAPQLMYDMKGLVLINLWFNVPFAALIITSGLGAIQDSTIESARDAGAGRLKVFSTMIFPLSIKDVLVAATFVFMGNVGSFTTPYLTMGSTSPRMLGISLFNQFNKYMDYEKTAALSVIMFLICSVSAGVYIYTNLKENKWD